MKTIAEIRMILAEHKNEIVEKYGVKEIGVFGSYLREEQKEVMLIFWSKIRDPLECLCSLT